MGEVPQLILQVLYARCISFFHSFLFIGDLTGVALGASRPFAGHVAASLAMLQMSHHNDVVWSRA